MDRADDRNRLAWALLGTLLCLGLVLGDLVRTSSNPLNIIQPGREGPSADTIREDFPGVEFPDGVGLDGQQFYVMARDPLHLDEHADQLDRPRYRWQRPMLAWLGWLLHPSGGGTGLIWAMFAVNLLAVAAGSLATGALGRLLGGPAWTGVLFGILPGAFYSLRVSVADALGLALAVAAVAVHARHPERTGAAVVLAVAAVLAKEATILVFVGWWLGERNRRGVALVALPGAAAALWFLVLRTWLLPDPEPAVNELVAPFTGWASAIGDRWLHGRELWGCVASGSAAIAAIGALTARRMRHPLAGIVAVHLAFTLVCNGNVLGQEFGGTRSTMALLLFSLVAIVTPAAGEPTGPPSTRAAAPDLRPSSSPPR